MFAGILSGTGLPRKSFFVSVQAMPPTAKENENLSASPETAQRPASTTTLPVDMAAKQQPVALEVPVTINGARTVEGSDKREPFSETTKTVLVFGNGAVIRLTSSVAPGQLLFLTNEKTKKEVVCQVVKSKNYRNVSGYVELEFTESVVGFWGMRFPSDRLGGGTQPEAPAPARSVHCWPAARLRFPSRSRPMLQPLGRTVTVLRAPLQRSLLFQFPLCRSQPRPLRRSPPLCLRPSIRKLHCIFHRLRRLRLFVPVAPVAPASFDPEAPLYRPSTTRLRLSSRLCLLRRCPPHRNFR